MTNKELLQASLLDILFDGRNKSYGAYALRRGYNRRLLLALGSGFLVLLLFILVNGWVKDKSPLLPPSPVNDGYKVTPVTVFDEPKPEPELVKPAKPKAVKADPAPPVATVKNTTIKIVEDALLPKTEVPDLSQLDKYHTGLVTRPGVNDDVLRVAPVEIKGSGNDNAPAVTNAPPMPSSPPAFPGGFEALKRFLYRHMATPDQLGLGAGEKKVVKARFIVGKDGSVSVIEILESGGEIFDKEVVRVCKKMPKWKPALQYGEPVSTSYILPVTFVSEEQ